MNKEFIKYEQSLALKELGFDEPCFGYYNNATFDTFEYYDSENTNSKLQSDYGGKKECTAPLYQQAFRWFREKHSLRFSIIDDHSENERPYSFTSEHEYYYDTGSGNNWFKTYEEAELECLKKLIEIVKNDKTT